LSVEELRKITADWLRAALDLEKISPEMVAERAGVAKSTVYRLLGAEVQPEETTVAALQGVLKHPYPTISPAPQKRGSDGDASRVPPNEDRASSGVVEQETSSGSIRGKARPGMRAGLAVLDDGAVEIVGFDVISRAIARAVERTVRQDELEHTRKGREHLAASLAAFGIQLQRGGVSATELFDVAEAIRRGELL
jgi:transcriptional regulator with XRE-family HTH domain